MHVIVFRFNALGTQAFTPDKSGRLREFAAFSSATVRAMMSQNPSLVVGDVASPVSTDMLHEVMAVTAGSGGVVYSAPDLDIPIKAGQTYYIAISAAGSVVVGIDP